MLRLIVFYWLLVFVFGLAISGVEYSVVWLNVIFLISQVITCSRHAAHV